MIGRDSADGLLHAGAALFDESRDGVLTVGGRACATTLGSRPITALEVLVRRAQHAARGREPGVAPAVGAAGNAVRQPARPAPDGPSARRLPDGRQRTKASSTTAGVSSTRRPGGAWPGLSCSTARSCRPRSESIPRSRSRRSRGARCERLREWLTTRRSGRSRVRPTRRGAPFSRAAPADAATDQGRGHRADARPLAARRRAVAAAATASS